MYYMVGLILPRMHFWNSAAIGQKREAPLDLDETSMRARPRRTRDRRVGPGGVS